MRKAIDWFLCLLGRHQWIDRGAYRRICRPCGRIAVFFPDEGWVEDS
jgi:hypothetical protein